MHCIVATDGSQASLVGARQFKWIADSREITDVTVVAVVSPYAAVPFANELGPHRRTEFADLSFADEAQVAVDLVAAEFDGWGPKIHREIRSGSPAQEIIRAAEDLDADLISLAAGSRASPGRSCSAAPPPGAAFRAVPGAGVPPDSEE